MPKLSSNSHGDILPRLLIVKDEPNVLYPIKAGLESRKFMVDAFTNPREALSAFTAGNYDLAILDISVPEMRVLSSLANF